ncbi:MAG TPA: cytochrome c [Pseudolabrys sp.]|nr:cytochrome c [Pseudolabrys sp.]
MTRAPTLLCLVLLLSGCDVSMTQQNRYGTYQPAPIFEDGTSAQPLPEHTVAQSDLARDDIVRNPPPATPQLLARGRERFDIYCSPCHGLSGDGDGIVVKRGFPAPPSYQEKRLVEAPASHFYDVITNGYGAMYSYAARVEPRDRWAIVAYIRALQLQRHAQAEGKP